LRTPDLGEEEAVWGSFVAALVVDVQLQNGSRPSHLVEFNGRNAMPCGIMSYMISQRDVQCA